MTWTAQPSGEGFTVPAGSSVAVVASVKASHSQSDLEAFAQKRGITITDYAEEGQRAGVGPDPRGPAYRYVAAMGNASSAVDLPWEAPWPLSMFDGTQLVSAWVAPAPLSAPTPPAPTAPLAPALPSIKPAVPIFFFLAAAYLWGRDDRKLRRRPR